MRLLERARSQHGLQCGSPCSSIVIILLAPRRVLFPGNASPLATSPPPPRPPALARVDSGREVRRACMCVATERGVESATWDRRQRMPITDQFTHTLSPDSATLAILGKYRASRPSPFLLCPPLSASLALALRLKSFLANCPLCSSFALLWAGV